MARAEKKERGRETLASEKEIILDPVRKRPGPEWCFERKKKEFKVRGSVELDLPGHLLVKEQGRHHEASFLRLRMLCFIFSFHHLPFLHLPSFLLLHLTLKNLMGRCPTTNSHLKLQSLQVRPSACFERSVWTHVY